LREYVVGSRREEEIRRMNEEKSVEDNKQKKT